MRIGFIGLGNMGAPMVGRLADAGHDVIAYDVTPAARERVAGPRVTPVDSVTDVTGDVVILMLPDSNVVEHVLLTDGLLGRLPDGAIVVDMSSSEPLRTKALAERATAAGVRLMDAPVSGGVAGARTGGLTVMAGGPQATFDAVRPVLDVFGSKVVHAGQTPGSGHAVKALNNLMSAAHLMVSSEALLAGIAFGLDPNVMLDVINTSSGRSGSTEVKWPKFVLPGTYDSGFGLRLMLKDMKVAVALEQQTGVPSPLSQAAVTTWAEAAEALPPTADHTEVAAWIARAASAAPQPDAGE